MCVFDSVLDVLLMLLFFVFKQKTAYEMRISDWSSDVCSSDLDDIILLGKAATRGGARYARRRYHFVDLPSKNDVGDARNGIGSIECRRTVGDRTSVV